MRDSDSEFGFGMRDYNLHPTVKDFLPTIIGVWGGASGASADAPGVGLELVMVLKYPLKR